MIPANWADEFVTSADLAQDSLQALAEAIGMSFLELRRIFEVAAWENKHGRKLPTDDEDLTPDPAQLVLAAASSESQWVWTHYPFPAASSVPGVSAGDTVLFKHSMSFVPVLHNPKSIVLVTGP